MKKKKMQKNEKKSTEKSQQEHRMKGKDNDSQKASFARHFVFLYAWRPCNNLKDLHSEISG